MTKSMSKKLCDLTFVKFRELAQDETLSTNEKIGFHDHLRLGFEEAIFADICSKLPALLEPGSLVLDIGCGCSDLTRRFISNAEQRNQEIFLLDSSEMLAHLPDSHSVHKLPGMYPRDFPEFCNKSAGTFHSVLLYSVLHYMVEELAVLRMFDQTLALLAPGGRLLLGDLPNVNKRNRFFSSANGIGFHQRENSTTELPVVSPYAPIAGSIDDSFVLGLVARARAQGYESYLMPQGANLPMANRREDLLFLKP